MITHMNIFLYYFIEKNITSIRSEEYSRSDNSGSRMLIIQNTLVPIYMTLSSYTPP